MNGARWLLVGVACLTCACAGPTVGTRDEILLGRFEGETLRGPRLRLHVIDVGQGDALLLQGPSGKVVLIDTGPAGARRALIAYLVSQGVKRIDLLVHSHAHADHVGNTAAVVDEFPVGTVLDPGFPHPAKAYGRALAALEKKKIPMKRARRGRTIGIGNKVTLTVLGPEPPFLSQTRSDVNANSVILRIDYGRIRILLTGDAEHETEKRLLKNGSKTLAAQVLKVAHHGSRFATHRPFLDAVSPQLALISAGVGNAYGHPAKKTLERLARRGTAVAITARDGHLLLETDGERLKLVRKSVGSPNSSD